uniref:Uncharacterized protein n=1 Tax=Mola mola TaxID=94237 RepID=A0A3Q3XBY8_MOLML
MSKLSFRARALDASKPLPVFRCEDLPDLHEYASINRAVPQMPTGMEKEEESVCFFYCCPNGGGSLCLCKMAAMFALNAVYFPPVPRVDSSGSAMCAAHSLPHIAERRENADSALYTIITYAA